MVIRSIQQISCTKIGFFGRKEKNLKIPGQKTSSTNGKEYSDGRNKARFLVEKPESSFIHSDGRKENSGCLSLSLSLSPYLSERKKNIKNIDESLKENGGCWFSFLMAITLLFSLKKKFNNGNNNNKKPKTYSFFDYPNGSLMMIINQCWHCVWIFLGKFFFYLNPFLCSLENG